MAPNGPPDDSDHQPTEHIDHGGDPYPPPDALPSEQQFEVPEFLDSFDEYAEPTPWYRKPLWLIGWGLLVIILIGLIIYGITELIRGGQGTGNTPSRTPTRTTTPSTNKGPPSSATTTTPPTSLPSSSAVPPQPTQEPTHQPTHRHHLPSLPSLPSVITIPQIPTVITLPPGLP